MSILLIGAFVAVGFLSFLFGLFYAALIEARDNRWMDRHLRTGTTGTTGTEQPMGAPAGVRR
jgi:hypothetical protein